MENIIPQPTMFIKELARLSICTATCDNLVLQPSAFAEQMAQLSRPYRKGR